MIDGHRLYSLQHFSQLEKCLGVLYHCVTYCTLDISGCPERICPDYIWKPVVVQSACVQVIFGNQWLSRAHVSRLYLDISGCPEHMCPDYIWTSVVVKSACVQIILSALYPQKLAITSPTSSGLSVGIVRSRTQTMEFVVLLLPRPAVAW
jgi:hypothetical protein